MTLTTLRLSSGNTMIIGDAFDEAQSPTFAGFNGGTATITHNAAAGQPVPTIYLAGGSGGIKVADGPADIDLTVNVPIVNFGGGSGLTKYGPGTMALGAVNQGNAVVVQRGILLVTGNNQLGTGPVSTQQTVVTPGSAGSGYGGTLQLSNNVSYSQPLTIAGGGVNGVSITAPGSTAALDNRAGDNTWSGPITLTGTGSNGTDPLLNQIGATAGTLRVSGVIGHSGLISASLAKTGAGDVVLTGTNANSYTGLTRLFGGRLIVEKDGALGAAGFTFNATGNTFQLAGSASTLALRAPTGSSGFTYSTFEVISTHGTGAPGFGQVDNLGGDNTFAGPIAIGGPNVGTPVMQAGSIGVTEGSLTLSGGLFSRKAVGETGHRVITKLGAGTLLLGGDGSLNYGPAVVPLPGGSSFNVNAGAVEMIGTAANTPNVPGVTTWNVNAGTALRLQRGGALGGAAVNLKGGTFGTTVDGLSVPNAINLAAGGGTIDNGANDATFTGAVGGAGGLSKGGVGRATLAGPVNGISGGPLAVHAGALTIAANGTASRIMKVSDVTIAGGARLELNDNDILVDYTFDSPYETLRGYVLDGIANGTGITTGRGDDRVLGLGESADLARTSHEGISIDDTTVMGVYTYYGDANLDGQVTTDDYVAIDLGLGTGDTWAEGDVDLSGSVTTDDYVAVDLNLGKGTADPSALADERAERIALHAEMFGASYVEKLTYARANGIGASMIPEPGGAGGFALAAIALRRSRRRRGRGSCA
jgi:autotransporter-associated beta strand protein